MPLRLLNHKDTKLYNDEIYIKNVLCVTIFT